MRMTLLFLALLLWIPGGVHRTRGSTTTNVLQGVTTSDISDQDLDDYNIWRRESSESSLARDVALTTSQLEQAGTPAMTVSVIDTSSPRSSHLESGLTSRMYINVTDGPSTSGNDTTLRTSASNEAPPNDVASGGLPVTLAIMILMVLICADNGLVLVVISINKELQTTTNIFVFNLAVVDFLTGIFLLQRIAYLVNPGVFNSPTGCTIALVLQLLFPHTSVLSLLCEYKTYFSCIIIW